MSDIKRELDILKESSIPYFARLRGAITKLQSDTNIERYTDLEKRREERKVLKPVMQDITEFFSHYLRGERTKIEAVREMMKRFCRPPESEFSGEDLRELRELLRQKPEKEKLNLIKGGMNGRAGFFFASVTDPSESLPEDILDNLRREFVREKSPDLLGKESDALNNYALVSSLAKQLSSVGAKLLDDAGLVNPLPLNQRWIEPAANQTEQSQRNFAEARHKETSQRLGEGIYDD